MEKRTSCLFEGFLEIIENPGERGGYALAAIARKIETGKASSGGLRQRIPPSVGVRLNEIPGDRRVLRESVSPGMAFDRQNWWNIAKNVIITPSSCSWNEVPALRGIETGTPVTLGIEPWKNSWNEVPALRGIETVITLRLLNFSKLVGMRYQPFGALKPWGS